MKISGNDIKILGVPFDFAQNRRVYIVRQAIFVLLLTTSWVLLSCHFSFGAESQPEPLTIAIVQPRNVAAYQDAMKGFLQALRRDVRPHVNTVVYESPEGLYKTLKQNRRTLNRADIDLIVTVGTSATAKVSREIHDIPVVFSMVLNPESIPGHRDGIVGVSLSIPPEFQLKMIKEVLPNVKTIGIIYEPKKNEKVVKSIAKLARPLQLGIKALAVTSQKDIPEALSQLSKDTDALLGLADNTVYTSRSAEFIIRYTIKEHFPFIGISQSYVKAGALYSLVFDSQDIGRQTAELVERLLAGVPASELQIMTPEKINIAINLRTAEIIGVDIPKKIRQKAAIIYE